MVELALETIRKAMDDALKAIGADAPTGTDRGQFGKFLNDAREDQRLGRPEEFATTAALLTNRKAFCRFVAGLALSESADISWQYAAVAVLLAAGPEYRGIRTIDQIRQIAHVAQQVTMLLQRDLPDDPARHERAAEFAVAYLRGLGLSRVPAYTSTLAQSVLRRSVECWLNWCIGNVAKFREVLFGSNRPVRRDDPHQDVERLYRQECFLWSNKILATLTLPPDARCRCWTRALGRNEALDPEQVGPSSNAGRRRQTCQRWHHLDAWRPVGPTGPLELWAFLRHACTGFTGRFRGQLNDLPSGLMWVLWNDPDEIEENPGRELILVKVFRRWCPDCGQHTFYAWCPNKGNAAWPEGCQGRDLSDARVDINTKRVVLAGGGPDRFNPRQYRVCRRCQEAGRPSVIPADRGPQCTSCGHVIPGAPAVAYTWVHGDPAQRPDDRAGPDGWIGLAIDELAGLLDDCGHPRNGWHQGVIAEFSRLHRDNDDSWYEYLAPPPNDRADWCSLLRAIEDRRDRPASPAALRVQFQEEILPLLIDIVARDNDLLEHG
jgi:hypothetical protein